MKKFLGVILPTLAVCVFLSLFCIGANAAEIVSNDNVSVVSYGLHVLANRTDMRVAGIKGHILNFSEKNFMCGMNLSDIDSIQITNLPDPSIGTLYYGSEKVQEGQSIQGDNISNMTFSSSSNSATSTEFKFRVNGSVYETTCKIYMLSSMNSSPTTDNASFASLNIETHKNIGVSGVLAGYDPEGDELTFEITKYPEDGVVKVNNKNYGTYTYIPSSGFSGKDSFEYVVYDKYGNYSASETVFVQVSAPSVSVVYSDLEGSDLHTYAISMTEDGIMGGVQMGDYYYFKPDVEVSRAEFVVTAMNAMGIKDVPAVSDTGFSDDADIRPEMKGYIALAYTKGYISGIRKNGEIYFCPDETVSLSEAAVILSNMIGYAEPVIKPVFADSDKIPAWSERAVISLHSLGVIECGGDSIEVSRTVTRGEMAKLLSKAMLITKNIKE